MRKQPRWIGTYIWEWITRFRNYVFLEKLDVTSETRVLVVDADGKISINDTIGVSEELKINYALIGNPQLFNPDSAAVSANTDLLTLASDESIAFITVNGQVLDDSEYSPSGNTVLVVPDNGFLDTSDEILVFQHELQSEGAGTEIVTNYSSLAAPQLFNPDASAVSSGSDIYTLASSEEVAMVTINGRLLASSEYALSTTDLYITPVNGFADTSDEVLVFQNEFTSAETGTVATNNYISFSTPQVFNPDAAAVSANTIDLTCSSEYKIALVSLNGQILDDSEYSLSEATLTVVPDEGFADVNDEIIVLQHTHTVLDLDEGLPGVVINTWRNVFADDTVTASDYGIDCSGVLAFDLDLPTAVGVIGQEYVIANRGVAVVTIVPDGSETIGGNTSVSLNQYDSVRIVSNGINWLII